MLQDLRRSNAPHYQGAARPQDLWMMEKVTLFQGAKGIQREVIVGSLRRL